jgi:hypothetical protein
MKTTIKVLSIMAGLSAFSGAVMSAEAPTMTTFSDGDVLTATELNDNNQFLLTSIDEATIQSVKVFLSIAAKSEAVHIAEYHKTYIIGDTGPGGGLVFHIENGGRNGLEAALIDQNSGTGLNWGCRPNPTSEVEGADGALLGSGHANTLDVMEDCYDVLPNPNAFNVSYNLEVNGYTDWFLPSRDELKAMHSNLHSNGKGGFETVKYWSSTEGSINSARAVNFLDGTHNEEDVKGENFRVRAIRAF